MFITCFKMWVTMEWMRDILEWTERLSNTYNKSVLIMLNSFLFPVLSLIGWKCSGMILFLFKDLFFIVVQRDLRTIRSQLGTWSIKKVLTLVDIHSCLLNRVIWISCPWLRSIAGKRIDFIFKYQVSEVLYNSSIPPCLSRSVQVDELHIIPVLTPSNFLDSFL